METTYDPYTKFEFRISIFKATMSVNSSEEVTSPGMRSESRGSSVSTGLREEYEDLLRYAVVTPVIDGKLPPTSRPKSPPFGATRRGVVQAEGTDHGWGQWESDIRFYILNFWPARPSVS